MTAPIPDKILIPKYSGAAVRGLRFLIPMREQPISRHCISSNTEMAWIVQDMFTGSLTTRFTIRRDRVFRRSLPMTWRMILKTADVDTMEKRFLIFPQRERQVLKINQILRNHLPIL